MLLNRSFRIAEELILGNAAPNLIRLLNVSSMHIASDKVTYRIAKGHDSESIEAFLLNHFFPHFVELGLNPAVISLEYFQNAIGHCLAKPTSVVALNGNDSIVGALLGSPFKPIADFDRWAKRKFLPVGISDHDIRIAYLAKIEDGLLERLAKQSCTNALMMHFVSVHSEYRKHGVGVRLNELTFENARLRGFDCVVAHVIKKASQNMAKVIGLKVLNVVKHEDLIDENGTRLLNCKDDTSEGLLMFRKL